jgi:toxin ParE1/3/4
MTQKVVRAPAAENDLAEIADFLASKSPRSALRFLDAAEAAFTRLLDIPALGGVYESSNPRLDGLRVWPVPGFPNYLIFYRPAEHGIEVVRVLHGARDLESYPS